MRGNWERCSGWKLWLQTQKVRERAFFQVRLHNPNPQRRYTQGSLGWGPRLAGKVSEWARRSDVAPVRVTLTNPEGKDGHQISDFLAEDQWDELSVMPCNSLCTAQHTASTAGTKNHRKQCDNAEMIEPEFSCQVSIFTEYHFTMTHETRSFMGQLKQEMHKKRKACTPLHDWHFYRVLVWVVCQYGGLWCWKVALFLSQGVICRSVEQCTAGCHQNACGQTTDMLKHFFPFLLSVLCCDRSGWVWL